SDRSRWVVSGLVAMISILPGRPWLWKTSASSSVMRGLLVDMEKLRAPRSFPGTSLSPAPGRANHQAGMNSPRLQMFGGDEGACCSAVWRAVMAATELGSPANFTPSSQGLALGSTSLCETAWSRPVKLVDGKAQPFPDDTQAHRGAPP